MSAAVNLFVFCALASALLSAPGQAAAAEDPASGQEGADRFVPSFAFNSGIRVQPWEASGSSRICRDCSLSDPMANIQPAQPPFMGNDLDVTPFVTGVLELMTPELPLPGSPRLFFGGEFGGAFGTERKVGREGDPGQVGSPLPPGGKNPFPPSQATGQGSEVVITYGELVYGAQAGVVFPFEMLGRQFRLRPTFGWTRFELDVESLVVDAECRQGGGQCNALNDNPGFLRAARISTITTESWDAIGPGIDLEMETGRLGPFGTSIMVGAQAYKLLGDTEVSLSSDTVLFNDPAGVDEYDVSSRFEVDPWVYRLTLGFRFSWLGTSR